MRYIIIILIVLLFAISGPVFALTSNDPHVEKQWHLSKIAAPSAWDQTTGSSDVVVAVLDTGFDLDHPDLVANVWMNPGEIAGDGIDNDQNGFIDDIHGYDFVDNDADPSPDQKSPLDIAAIAHGTVIAGVIGAVGNNAEGVAGINWHVRLMSVRILDNEGSGNSLHAREAILYAVKNGADVINLSFTGKDMDPLFKQALQTAYEAGVVVVAAVGNAGVNGAVNVDVNPIYPACHGEGENTDWVIGVAATNEQDARAEFSNYGALCTDISAPGQSITSTMYHDANWNLFNTGLYTTGWSGTSMAVPMVAGAAALVRSVYPTLGPSEIESILRLSADPVFADGEAKGKMGAGRLNVQKALAIAPSFIKQEISSLKEMSRPRYQIAVASESGSDTIQIFTNAGILVGLFDAYGASFEGGVRLAMGDVNGDGNEEIITVPSRGSARVHVFDFSGQLITEFEAFSDSAEVNGMFVNVGDVDGDGAEEIAVSTDRARYPSLRLFDGDGKFLSEHEPFPMIKDEQSVRVALADVNGDGKDEVAVSLGAGYEPIVRVFSPLDGFEQTFYAYAKTYTKGVFLSAGDLDGDGDDELVTGTDNGGGPQVQIFDGNGKWLGTFFAYDKGFRGGVRLTVGRLSDWPGASIITAAGPGGGPHIRIFNGYAKLIGTFFTDDPSDHRGINSAAWSF